MHAPFDEQWFRDLLHQLSSRSTHKSNDSAPAAGANERAHDWGEAPDTSGFVGRVEELGLLSENGQFLASGGVDGMVRLWNMRSGDCLRTLRSDRCYERLDITGLTGVTDAQRAALCALGAIEYS
jgi:WD40 repeat protein